MTHDLAAALLRDVPRIWAYSYDVNEAASGAEPEEWKTYQTWDTTDPYPILGKEYVAVSEVLAALTAALDGVDERAGEVLEGVTPGPWLYRPRPHDDWGWVIAGDAVLCQARDPDKLDAETLAHHREKGRDPWEANARFIAWCREGVPALLAQNAALRAERDDWQTRAMEQMNRATKASQDAEAAEAQIARVEGLTKLLKEAQLMVSSATLAGAMWHRDTSAALSATTEERK